MVLVFFLFIKRENKIKANININVGILFPANNSEKKEIIITVEKTADKDIFLKPFNKNGIENIPRIENIKI